MSPTALRRCALGLAALLTGLAIACSGGSSASPATASPLPTPTAGGLGPPQPQAERIMAHIQFLAGQIGTRLAGSPEEARAIDYAQRLFKSWGYAVEVQPFPASGDLLRSATLSFGGGGQPRSVRSLPFYGSDAGQTSQALVDAGTGAEGDFPPDARGAVVLVQRADVPFNDMLSRARAAGAAALIVANKEPGLFLGAVPSPSGIPVVAIDQADGAALRALAKGEVQVTVQVGSTPQVSAHNVIARPLDGHCRTITGGHYDSVSVSVGATDNASGAATVLELARAAAAAHLTDDCFVLFGAEEEGLLGSAFFVEHLTVTQKSELQAMFNYDVTAGVAPPILIGNGQLIQRALTLARQQNENATVGALPPGASSDFASFLDGGIPALMLTADDLGIFHTPRDSLANLRQETLQPIADLGFALLRDAAQTPAPTP